jgi:hypothetical protein
MWDWGGWTGGNKKLIQNFGEEKKPLGKQSLGRLRRYEDNIKH